MGDDDAFQRLIRNRSLAGANEADVILFLVDGKTRVNADDEAVARILQDVKPVFLVVNKLDTRTAWTRCGDLPAGPGRSCGQSQPLQPQDERPLGRGRERAEEGGPARRHRQEDGINVAIVGRPNCGKSSLTNKLTANDRIVSDVAGYARRHRHPYLRPRRPALHHRGYRGPAPEARSTRTWVLRPTCAPCEPSTRATLRCWS